MPCTVRKQLSTPGSNYHPYPHLPIISDDRYYGSYFSQVKVILQVVVFVIHVVAPIVVVTKATALSVAAPMEINAKVHVQGLQINRFRRFSFCLFVFVLFLFYVKSMFCLLPSARYGDYISSSLTV